MFIIGLTGGIGSGKTTVSDMFAELGVDIVDTDKVAREVVELGSDCLSQIQMHFGNTVIQQDGTLDRGALRHIIFAQPEEKIWLENLLHPVIRQETRRALAAGQSEYVILSSPLLLESSDADLVHRTVVVDLPEAMQIARAGARDGADEEQIRAIIATQMPREDKLHRADDVIDNSADLDHTRTQVEKLHAKYVELARHADSEKS